MANGTIPITPPIIREPQTGTKSPVTSRRQLLPIPLWRHRIVGCVRASSVEQRFLTMLLLIFAAKGFAISLIHQPFTGHDELMHYSYLSVLVEEGRVPVIPDLREWQNAFAAGEGMTHDRFPERLWPYCQFSTEDVKGPANTNGSNFCSQPKPIYAANMPPPLKDWPIYPVGWIYTANHPPLYYLLMAPIYWLSDGQSPASQQYLLRMATIPFGILTVLFAFLTIRTLFPRDRFLAVTVPAFVAFQPQISYESAMLNNDIVAIAFTSAVIYLVVLGLKKRFPIWNCVLIGGAYGLAILSKNTSLTAGAIVAFAMIAGLGWKNWKAWLIKGAIAVGVASLLIWPWFAYMWHTYGDFTALGRIQVLQYWNYENGDPPSIWQMLTDRNFFWTRWAETWGAFGWRMIWLSNGLLQIIFYPTLLGVVGLAIYAVRFWKTQKSILQAQTAEDARELRSVSDSTLAIEQWQVVALLALGLTCVMSYYAILQFGLSFSLTQARYYFPAINAGAILLLLGVRSWFPRRWLPYVAVGIFIALVALNVAIYTEWVIPWSVTGQYEQVDAF